MSCGSPDGSCSSETVQVSETLEVFTPFTHTIVDKIEDEIKYNYDQYDLTCFSSKMAPIIRQMGVRYSDERATWSHRLVSKIRDNIIVLVLAIYEGDTRVPITSTQLQSELQLAVDTITQQQNKSDILLLHPLFPVHYRGVMMDTVWLDAVLKMLPLPESVRYGSADTTEYAYGCEYKSEPLPGVYIRLERTHNFLLPRDSLYMSAMDTLLSLYNTGTIVLSNTAPDLEMVSNWDLVDVTAQHSIVNISSTPYRLYQPRWNNRWIAPNPTQFLMDRRAGTPYISFKIHNNSKTRHSISKKLSKEGFRFVFSNEEVLVWTRNIVRADRAHQKIVSGSLSIYPNIYTDSDGPLPTTYKDRVTYRDLEYGEIVSVSL
jgi:hypothetical protein